MSSEPDAEIAVIVTLSDKVNPGHYKDKDKATRRAKLVSALKGKAKKSQDQLLRFLKNNAGKKIKPLWIFNGIAAKVKPQVIYALANRPEVESISLDDILVAPVTNVSTATPAEWNLDLVNAVDLWDVGYSGGGIVVANMDTGVDYNHPDLVTNWRGGSNSWFDPNGEHNTPYDSNGHGTQTMGIMVGGDASGTAIGVAPDAQWIAVKIYADSGTASYSIIHLGFQWLLDPDNDAATNDAPDVVNGSWGLRDGVNQCITEFQADIQIFKAAGIGVVFSAGNEGPGFETSISPANYPESLAVGAVDVNLEVSSLSSRGPSACDSGIYPQLVAPGVAVRTSDLTFGGIFPDSYTYASGTSFAAPHVSAGLALLASVYPDRSLVELEQAMKDSALDLGLYGPDNDYGYGMLDIAGAFAALQSSAGCSDADADGYFAEGSCGTEVDCDDFNATINPAACDIARDGIDQNCDGVDRAKGKQCPIDDSSGGSEGKGNTCSDGLDNDGDGLIDCDDSDCSKNKACRLR
ncbi:MAG: S8 family serine peptidase [Desulfocapsa sp.]|nr:S8 family serine peptidase [Desulfocapsa sp.]